MKHIDKVFRDKLYNQKATVPEGMWDKIAPALEEKSARSILWFWFAGIMTLILGAIAYLLFTNYQAAKTNNIPLAAETQIEETLTPMSHHQTLALSDDLINTSKIDLTESIEKQNEVTSIGSPKLKKNTFPKKRKAKTPKRKTFTPSTIEESKINTSVSEGISTENLQNKPASLVITKSYFSHEGSIIEKSDLNKGTENSETTYNVFINSEGLNAGALLRIIEPLENIPLPFPTILKKKIIL
jgi:hypothetical protein